MSNAIYVAARAHYAEAVKGASDSELAAIILDTPAVRKGVPAQAWKALADLANDEAQARGHDLPTLWALSMNIGVSR